MSPSTMPIVDDGNPMYCPEVPATRYLQRLQHMKPSSRHLDNTFAHRISIGSREHHARPAKAEQSANLHHFMKGNSTQTSYLCVPLAPPPAFEPSKRELDDIGIRHNDLLFSRSKRIRSDISQTSSFVLSPNPNQPHFPTILRAATIQDSSDGFYRELFKTKTNKLISHHTHRSPGRVAAMESELYGHPIGDEKPEDISRLLADLNRELPGISLTRQLSHLERISHQDIVEVLGVNGHLARHILDYFRGSHAHSLDLSATLSEEDGLNILKPQVVLDVFALPHSFTGLRALNLNHVALDDFHMTKIHHLPSLQTLLLNGTGIGNEAVGHLTALKHTLKELHMEYNPRINDECITSLCLFPSMILLRIFGTSIGMHGLRRLASSVHQERRELDIEIPQECDNYLNNLHSHYQLHPSSPLITVPHLCSTLSINALKHNLAAHAVFNPSIFLSGSRPELEDRLRRILETRLADRVVKEVAWGYESSDEYSERDNDTLDSEGP